MSIYDATALSRLLDKLDYEIWLLDFLGKTEGSFEGGAELSTIELKNNETTAGIGVGFTEHLGAGYAKRVIDAISPLVFTASYKILDMVYEWILEENQNDGVVAEVPWRFSEKLALIAGISLKYPSLFISNRYLQNYSFALLKNLLPYRNEVVHNHKFSVSTGMLVVDDVKTGYQLRLDRRQLGFLVRFVTALGKCLGGKLSFDMISDRLFKYHLDQLVTVHGLAAFGQSLPLVVNVELSVPKTEDVYPANLKQVRETIQRIYPKSDVLFNLIVLAFDGETLAAKWYFPAGDAPTKELEIFTPKSHAQYRQSDVG